MQRRGQGCPRTHVSVESSNRGLGPAHNGVSNGLSHNVDQRHVQQNDESGHGKHRNLHGFAECVWCDYRDTTNTTFTFTPSAPLVVGTMYTATVTTGVRSETGVAMAADFVWTFTPMACPGPIAAGASCSFGILAGSTVTNTGLTNVSGDVGVWPGSAIVGFPPGVITGMMHAADPVAMAAQGALTTSYNNAAGAPSPSGNALPPDIGGITYPAGVYHTMAQPSLGITGNLTLDGNGDPNAVFIFQIASTLTTAAGQVNLIGLAQSKNVIWQVGSSATLGINTKMSGNIMAQASITLNTGASLNGRALARSGAVTLDTNAVVVPPCP